MQAVILVGGEGTRLRPLTSTVPKPVVPLVDRPFIAYMLEWLRGARRRRRGHVLRVPGRRASATSLGDGSAVRAAAALRRGARAARHRRGRSRRPSRCLDERFLMLNGDVLTDIDLTAQIAQHEATGAHRHARPRPRGRPLRLRPRAPARGPASCASSSRSRGPDEIDTNLIQRGRLRPRALGARPDRPARRRSRSSARSGRGSSATACSGSRAEAYWLDIGTPERYLQGTFDILEGNVRTARGASGSGNGFLSVDDAGAVDGRVVPPALVERGCRIDEERPRGRPSSCSGEGVSVGKGSTHRAQRRPRRGGDRRRLRPCAAASSRPGRGSATTCR